MYVRSCWLNVHAPAAANLQVDTLCLTGCRVPSLLERTSSPPTGGPLLQLYVSGNNTVFLFVLAACAYGVVRLCLLFAHCCRSALLAQGRCSARVHTAPENLSATTSMMCALPLLSRLRCTHGWRWSGLSKSIIKE